MFSSFQKNTASIISIKMEYLFFVNFAVMDPTNANEFSAIDILIDDTIFEIFNESL